MNRLHNCIALIVALALSSCITTKAQQLPAFELAAVMEGPANPRVFFAEQIDGTSLPAAVPFAIVSAVATSAVGRDSLATSASKKAREFGADFILIGDTSSFQTGSTYQHVGYGVGYSRATYGQSLVAAAYRVCPSRLGFSSNPEGMITAISNDSVRSAGMLEGDTLVSLNGAPVSRKNTSPHFKVMLGLQVGSEFELVWIRPGTGRMAGTATTLANPPRHLEITDSLEASLAARKLARERRTNIGSPVEDY